MFEVAERLRNVKVSASAAMTRKVRELRAQGVQIVGLSSGEPDFPTPPHAIAGGAPGGAGRRHQVSADRRREDAEGGDPAQVQARQQPRLRARRDHGLQRQQADDVRRTDGEREPGRRGDHPGAVLDLLRRPGGRRGRQPGAGVVPREQPVQAARRRPRRGHHAAHQVGRAEFPQQPDRRGVLAPADEGDHRRAAGASARAGDGRRHLRASDLRRLRLLHRRRDRAAPEGPHAHRQRRLEGLRHDRLARRLRRVARGR